MATRAKNWQEASSAGSSFPAGVSHSFPVGALHGLLSLLVLNMVFLPYKFLTLKFCHKNQTKWSPLIDISQAMTPSLPQAIFFSYALLQKIAMKSCKQDISKHYLSFCIET